jgi:phosphoserine phosphatase
VTQSAELLAQVKATQAAILSRYPSARFLAFWDLDGTLLAGDCSEGFRPGGRQGYSGLVQLGIENGFSRDYRGARGHAKCVADYEWLKENIGAWMAYPFLAQIFAGAGEEELSALAARHFEGTLRRFYLPASRVLFDSMMDCGVEQHILSASAEVFVRGAARSLGIPPQQLHGIRLHSRAGRLTRDLVHPVTFAEGKLEKLHQVVLAMKSEQPQRPVFVLGAFGDNFANDGPFMAYVARQELPVGSAVTVMVNAGIVPNEYKGLFSVARHGMEIAGA